VTARVRKAALVALLVLGFAQMTGAVLEECGAARAGAALKGLAAASAASPAPKVFSSVRGLETFSTSFALEWDEPGGVRCVTLTPELYARFRGPYNRRNAYGAALAYGPVLASNPATRPMLDGVLAYALGGDAPLVRELGLDASARTGPVRVVYGLRRDDDAPGLTRAIECPRR